MSELKNVVGLFGTCGSSTWRQGVMERLQREGIEYFNPQVPNWSKEFAVIEAEHMASDKVILMVITTDTTGFGSLAEVGFALRNAEQNGQTLVLCIQDWQDPKDAPKSDAKRTRILVTTHANKAGLTVHADLDEAVTATIKAMRS